MTYLKRSLETRIMEAERNFPLLLISGPRGTGKTSLIRSLFPDRYNYVPLESRGISIMAREHPDSFLEIHSGPVILDGIDRAPELLPFIAQSINRISGRGHFILISSRDLFPARAFSSIDSDLMAWFSLFPFTSAEFSGNKESFLPWEEGQKLHNPFMNGSFLWQNLFRGFFPEIAGKGDMDPTQWHTSYLERVIEEDIRFLRKKVPPHGIRKLLHILAIKTGEPLNFSEIARSLGMTLHILKAWVNLLVETYQIFLLPPLVHGTSKPVIKSPKAYFSDTGLLCHVLGIKSSSEAEKSPYREKIFETAVIGEVFKRLIHKAGIADIYFWKKATGMEISLAVKNGGLLVPLEVSTDIEKEEKADKGIRFFRKEFGKRVGTGYVINPGKYNLPLTRGINALPFSKL